jgi:hypothetical protein
MKRYGVAAFLIGRSPIFKAKLAQPDRHVRLKLHGVVIGVMFAEARSSDDSCKFVIFCAAPVASVIREGRCLEASHQVRAIINVAY